LVVGGWELRTVLDLELSRSGRYVVVPTLGTVTARAAVATVVVFVFCG